MSKQLLISLYSLSIILATLLLGVFNNEAAIAIVSINACWFGREYVKAKNGK